jgi:hypothetical protein
MWSNVNYPSAVKPIKSWTDDALSVVPLCPQFEGQAMELFGSDQVAIVVAGMESSALAKKLCAELNAWVGLRAYLLLTHKYKLERHPELGLGYFEELFHRASRVIKVGELSHARVVEMWNNYGLPDMPEEQRKRLHEMRLSAAARGVRVPDPSVPPLNCPWLEGVIARE